MSTKQMVEILREMQPKINRRGATMAIYDILRFHGTDFFTKVANKLEEQRYEQSK